MPHNLSTPGANLASGYEGQIFKNEIIPILQQHYPEDRGSNSFMKPKSLCYQNQTKILKGKHKGKIY